MGFDFATAQQAAVTYQRQSEAFRQEATAFRRRAEIVPDPAQQRLLLHSAADLNEQAERVAILADDMHRQIGEAQRQAKTLTFEEQLAAARVRGRRRGMGDEGLEN